MTPRHTPREGQSWSPRPSNVPETQFLTHYSSGPERWTCEPEGFAGHPPVHRLYIHKEDGFLLSHPADAAYRAILAPTDPVKMLLRHRALVERLRTAIGSRLFFEKHLMPVMAGWGAMVQSLPRDERGLWSGADGLFEAGLMFAIGSLSAIDARVIGTTMAPQARDEWTARDERGLWSGADGLFEAGLMFAIGSLSAIDARVIGTTMAPQARDEWTARLRVAAAIAGVMSDSRKLAQLKLEAGTENPANGIFDVICQFNPSEETALQFAVTHIGRVMRLTRYTPKKAAGRLPTVSADILRLVVPTDTLRWLGSTQLDDGETVLTALKAAVTYATGFTDAERMISEAAARGREWATNRRSAEAARREGSCPLMRGFASVFEADLRRRILHGKWRLNDGESPIVYAEDGIYLAWPRTFTEITASAEDNWLFREVPDEPDVAADILASSDMIFRSEAGNPVWMTDDNAPCRRGTWLRVTDSQGFIALARRAADKANEVLPDPLAPIFDKDIRKENVSDEVLQPIFVWKLDLPMSMLPDGAVLIDAVERLNHAKVGQVFTHPQGLFIPETLLPLDWWSSPGDAEGALVATDAPSHPLVAIPRRSYARRVLMMNEGAKVACRFDPASRSLSLEPHVLEGIVISKAYITPVRSYARRVLMMNEGAKVACRFDPASRSLSLEPHVLEGIVISKAYITPVGRWPGSGETVLETPTITDLKPLDLPDVPKKADSDKKKEAVVKDDTTENAKVEAPNKSSSEATGSESQKTVADHKTEPKKNAVETNPEPRHVIETNPFDSEDDESDDDDDTVEEDY